VITNLVISTIAFFVAVFFLNRYFEGQGMDKTFTRKILVYTLAYVASTGTGMITEQVTTAIYGKDESATADLSQLLKSLQAASGHSSTP